MVTPRPRSRTEPGLQTARTAPCGEPSPAAYRAGGAPFPGLQAQHLSTACSAFAQYLSTELFLTPQGQIVSVSYDNALPLQLRHPRLTTGEAPGRFTQPERWKTAEPLQVDPLLFRQEMSPVIEFFFIDPVIRRLQSIFACR